MRITGGTITGGLKITTPPFSQNWFFGEDLSQFNAATIDYYVTITDSWTVDAANNLVWADVNEYNFIAVSQASANSYSITYDEKVISPNTYSSGAVIGPVKQMSNAEITALLVNMPVGTRIDLKQNSSSNVVEATFVSGNLSLFGSALRLRLTVNENLSSLGNYCGTLVKYTSNALNTLAITGAD